MVTATLATLLIVQAHKESVTAIANNSNMLVITGGWDMFPRSWELDAGPVRDFASNRKGYVTDLAFSADGKLFAASFGDGTVAVYGLGSSKPQWSRNTGTSHASAVRFLPNGDVVTAGYDNLAKRWRGKTGALVRTYRGLPSDAYTMTTSRNGQFITAGGPLGVVTWNANDGKLVSRFRPAIGDFSAGDLAFLPDHRTVVIQSLAGLLIGLDTRSGKELWRMEGTQAWSLDVSPDGKRAVVGTSQGKVSLIDLTDRSVIKTVDCSPNEAVNVVKFSPDGSAIFAGTTNGRAVRFKSADLDMDHEYVKTAN